MTRRPTTLREFARVFGIPMLVFLLVYLTVMLAGIHLVGGGGLVLLWTLLAATAGYYSATGTARLVDRRRR